MSTITCPRCGYVASVTPTGRTSEKIKMDMGAWEAACQRKDETTGRDPLTCPSMKRAAGITG